VERLAGFTPNLTTLKEELQMDQTFSFFPFGALFCLTLFCFVAVRIFAISYRYRDNKQMNRLKNLVIKGEMTETEYQRLKNLFTK
jgi:hypothetical protein